MKIKAWSRSCLFVPALFVVVALPAVESQARELDYRSECVYGEGADGEALGRRNAESLITRAWATLERRCTQVETLADAIFSAPLARPDRNRSSSFQSCFYRGFQDSLYDRVAEIYDGCSYRCTHAGDVMGQFGARLYCAQSQALGGLVSLGYTLRQPPLKFCGVNAAVGCRTKFSRIVQNECAAYGPDYRFSRVFSEVRAEQCNLPRDPEVRGDY